MRYKMLRIRNFRPFFGEHQVEFSTSIEKPITLISGSNATGKASLMSALLWCLEGDAFLPVDLGDKRRVVNERAAIIATQDNRAAVVEVSLSFSVNGQHYTATRQMPVVSAGDTKSEMRVLLARHQGNDEAASCSRREAQLNVKDVLPPGICSLLFLSCEHLMKVSKSGLLMLLREAWEGLSASGTCAASWHSFGRFLACLNAQLRGMHLSLPLRLSPCRHIQVDNSGRIILCDADHQQLRIDTSSAGETTVLAILVVLGFLKLIHSAGEIEGYPLVLMSPFGMLDTHYREWLAEVLADIPLQLVLILPEHQLDSAIISRLIHRIGKVYRLAHMVVDEEQIPMPRSALQRTIVPLKTIDELQLKEDSPCL